MISCSKSNVITLRLLGSIATKLSEICSHFEIGAEHKLVFGGIYSSELSSYFPNHSHSLRTGKSFLLC